MTVSRVIYLPTMFGLFVSAVRRAAGWIFVSVPGHWRRDVWHVARGTRRDETGRTESDQDHK